MSPSVSPLKSASKTTSKLVSSHPAKTGRVSKKSPSKSISPHPVNKTGSISKKPVAMDITNKNERPRSPSPKNDFGSWRYTYVLPFFRTQAWVWEPRPRYRLVNLNKEYPNQRFDAVFSVERKLAFARYAGIKATF